MGNEVKVSLSLDGSQARKEIKLIDKELDRIGKGGSSSSSSSSSGSSPSEGDSARAEDKIIHELTLIRKELQKYKGASGNNNQSESTPAASSDSGSADSVIGKVAGSGKDGLSKAVGNLLTSAVLLRAAASAFSSLKNSAQSAQKGASLAYQTYGSTLAYSDFSKARKDSSNLGAPYGMDSTTVMNVGSENMARAGFTTVSNYESDMTSILRTSKALGIDAGSMASSSGFMTSIGVVESGNQKRFADMLAESIVDAQMTGREKEQLQVLEQISSNLGSKNTTVTDSQLGSTLGIYNALVNTNSNLKGERGGSLTTTMMDLASSGNGALDTLAGLGTKYTGIAGKLELSRLAESNSKQYWSQVYEGVQKWGLSDDYFKMLLYNNVGSVSKAEEIMSSLPDVAMNTYNVDDTSNGEKLVESSLDLYSNDRVSTAERNIVEKQERSDDRGDVINWATNPLKALYNSLPDWGQQGMDAAEFGAKAGASYLGVKAVGKIIDKTGIPSKLAGLFGKGGSAASSVASNSVDDIAAGVANSVDDVIAGVANSADDVVSGVANSVDDVIAGAVSNSADDVLAGVVSNSADDVLAGVVSNSADDVIGGAVSGGAGSLAGKALGPLMQFGIGLHQFLTAKNNYNRAKAVGQTGFGIAGGILGSAAGPLGSIAGGFLGSELGSGFGNVYNDVTNFLDAKKFKKMKKELESKATFGKPSDYGLDKSLDSYVEYNQDTDGKVYGSLSTYKLKEIYGKDYESNPNFLKFRDASMKIIKDNSPVAPSSSSITDYNSFLSALNSNMSNGKFNLSFLKGTNQGQAEQWLGQAFPQLKQSGAFTGVYPAGKSAWSYTTGDSEVKDWESFMENLGINGQTTATNTEAIKNLTTAVNDNKKAIENSSTSRGIKFNPFSNFSMPKLFSHAVGNDFVPYDNYTALLHRGEMVLTAPEASDYRQGKFGAGNSGSNLNININVRGEVAGMTGDNQSKITEAIIAQINSSNLQNMISNGFVRVQNY